MQSSISAVACLFELPLPNLCLIVVPLPWPFLQLCFGATIAITASSLCFGGLYYYFFNCMCVCASMEISTSSLCFLSVFCTFVF
jgi:hypothetical protein